MRCVSTTELRSPWLHDPQSSLVSSDPVISWRDSVTSSPRRRAKRSLSQNFLVDPNIQRKIVALLDPGPEDTVLEIGPGHGELSQHILGRCRQLILIEKDHELAGALAERWGGDARVTVHDGDALDPRYASILQGKGRSLAVSNVPYNITSPLIFALLEFQPLPARIVLLVQREVGRRIVARPGHKSYGALSVGVQVAARVKRAFSVGRLAFRPVPRVDSEVIELTPRPEPEGGMSNATLRHVTRACFNRRRKQMQKILRTAPEFGSPSDPFSLLESCGINPKGRPDSLEPEAFVRLAETLSHI